MELFKKQNVDVFWDTVQYYVLSGSMTHYSLQ